MTPPPPSTSRFGVAPSAVGPDAPATDAYVHVIGDIGVTRSLVVTPAGTCSLSAARWRIEDHGEVRLTRPRWATIAAVALMPAALLGLLFLRIKNTTVGGFIMLTVDGGGITYATKIAVANTSTFHELADEIERIRSLSELSQSNSRTDE